MHGAGAAKGNAAAKLRSRQPNDVAQSPQQGHVIGYIQVKLLTINSERGH
jgi:hypothetical protein